MKKMSDKKPKYFWKIPTTDPLKKTDKELSDMGLNILSELVKNYDPQEEIIKSVDNMIKAIEDNVKGEIDGNS